MGYTLIFYGIFCKLIHPDDDLMMVMPGDIIRYVIGHVR